jgi:phage terminase small subunit
MQIFADEYLVDFHQTNAAIRAGYSEKTAYSIGNENLKKPEIKAYIAKRIKEKNEEIEKRRFRVLNELEKIAFDEIKATKNDDGSLTLSQDYKDKLKALDLLGKSVAMYTEKLEHSGGMSVNINIIPAGKKK